MPRPTLKACISCSQAFHSSAVDSHVRDSSSPSAFKNASLDLSLRLIGAVSIKAREPKHAVRVPRAFCGRPQRTVVRNVDGEQNPIRTWQLLTVAARISNSPCSHSKSISARINCNRRWTLAQATYNEPPNVGAGSRPILACSR